MLLGVDVGGTFTDAALLTGEGALLTAKAPTTPDDQSQGEIAAVEAVFERAGVTARVPQPGLQRWTLPGGVSPLRVGSWSSASNSRRVRRPA